MPAKYTTAPAVFHADFDFNFDDMKKRKPTLYDKIRTIAGARWNPFL
jgi:hypothetical protein